MESNERRLRYRQWYLYFLTALFVLYLVVSVLVCIMVRSVEFIQDHPGRFALEMAAWSVVPALPYLLFLYTRGEEVRSTARSFGLLVLKLALVNMVFQVTGTWDAVLQWGSPRQSLHARAA